jgi:hypothetical protein
MKSTDAKIVPAAVADAGRVKMGAGVGRWNAGPEADKDFQPAKG